MAFARVALLVAALALAAAAGADAHYSRQLIAAKGAEVHQTRQLLAGNATVSINVTSLPHFGSWVKITFDNPNPKDNDAIAFLTPANANPKVTVPQKSRWCVYAPNYLKTGKGSFTFKIYAHSPFKIMLVNNPQNNYQTYKILAQTKAIPIADQLYPHHIHLVLTNVTSEIKVQWATGAKYNDTPTVHYAKLPSGKKTLTVAELTSSASANTDTITPEEMCGSIANDTGYIFPGYFHTANMTSLAPSSTYAYAVGSQAGGFSPVITFKTAIKPGSSGEVNFLVLADLGYSEVDGSQDFGGEYSNNILSIPPDQKYNYTDAQFDNALYSNWLTYNAGYWTILAMTSDKAGKTLVIHNGDLSYAQGFHYSWDVYWDNYEQLLQNVPYIATEGNHERDWPGSGDRYTLDQVTDSGGECGVPYSKRIPLPIQGPKKQWYSLDHGPVHFIQFSTEMPFGAGSEQYNFILNDLQNVDRSKTPWVVAGFHRPFLAPTVEYTAGAENDGAFQRDLQLAFEDMFMLYQVDFTTYGHIHVYSRTCPVWRKVCQPNDANNSATAPVHLLLGHAGASFSWQLNPEIPPYYETVALVHGFMSVQANMTHFTGKVINSLTGTLTDQFTYTKPANWQPDQNRQYDTMNNHFTLYNPSWYEATGLPDNAQGELVNAVETVLFSQTGAYAIKQLFPDAFVKNPNAPDYFGDMEPFWQTLDGIYAKYAFGNNTLAPGTSDFFYQQYWSKLFQLFRNSPSGTLKGPAYTQKAIAFTSPYTAPDPIPKI